MLLEVVKKYYGEKYDLNCSETILYAANEEYGLNLSKETFKTMAAFGGGMAIEATCHRSNMCSWNFIYKGKSP